MNRRVAITIIALALYVGFFNYYLYELTHHALSHRRICLMYDYITLAMIIFFMIDMKFGLSVGFHEQFNDLCVISVIVNFIIIICTHEKLLIEPSPTFFSFNGGMLIATIMILISCWRHGYFSKKYND